MSDSPTAIVVDASVAIKWIVKEEGSDQATALRSDWQKRGIFLHAPDFLLIELHNIVWKKLARGQIRPDDPLVGQTPHFGMDLNWTPAAGLLTSAFLLAMRFQISIYDALYAELAQSLSAPLYTADRGLIQKLKTSAIEARGIEAAS